MSKKTFIILIVFIIFLGVIGFFVVSNTARVGNVEVEKTDNPEFVPFSGSAGGEVSESQNSGNINFIELQERANFNDFDAEDSNFTQITGNAVSGYTLFSKIFQTVKDPDSLVSDSLVEVYNFLDFPSMKIGDTGEGVSALQKVLNRISEQTNPLPTDGTFETATKNAVIAFQTKHNLTADGIVGNGTKAKLNEIQGLSKNPKDFEPIILEEEKFTIRYQEKKNGHIFDFGIDDKFFEKVSNKSFAPIHESFFGNNGNSVVVRYADSDTIFTYLGNLVFPDVLETQTEIIEEEEGENQANQEPTAVLEGDFLPLNIPFVSINADGSKLLYLERVQNRTFGRVRDLVSNQETIVLNSKFSEWLPEFVGVDSFILNTKASFRSLGYSYIYDANKQDSFDRGVGGYTGLTTKYNSAGTKVLLSTNNGGRFLETYVYDFNDHTMLSLGIKTLAEKCVWTDLDNILCAVPRFIMPEDYPDAWYKGEVLFNDRLWSVNTENGLEKLVSTLKHKNLENIDAVNPVYKDGILLIQNKYDYTLWMLDLR